MDNKLNPWTQIWIHPQQTMRALIEKNPFYMIIYLALIGGIVGIVAGFSHAWMQHPEKETAHIALMIVVMVILGALLGIVHLYFGGWLYKVTGSWLGGKGSFTSVKCAVGWSSYIFIIANIANILQAFFLHSIIPLSIFATISGILGIWGFVVFMNLLGAAHQFSAWRALLAFIIALFLIFVVVMIIALVIPLLSPLFAL